MSSAIFAQLLSDVFGLDYLAYLGEKGKGFCEIRVPTQLANLELISKIGISKSDADALLASVQGRQSFQCMAGYYTASLDPVPRLQFAHDILFVSDKLLKVGEKRMLAIIYHEARHCFRQTDRFQAYPESSPAFIQGRIIRKYTQYQFSDGIGHDDQWFALIAGAARTLAKQKEIHFKNVRDVVESAVYDDWTQEPMDDVDWQCLEARND